MLPPPAAAPLTSVPVHDGIEEWMAAALTGGLSSPEERRLFEDHLAGCASCRELFAHQTAMSQTIQNAFDTVHPLPGFEQRLTAAFRLRRDAGIGRRLRAVAANLWRRPAWRVAGAVAGVAALVVLGCTLTDESLPIGGWVVIRGSRGASIRNDARVAVGAIDQESIENNKLEHQVDMKKLESSATSAATPDGLEEAEVRELVVADAIDLPPNAKRGPVAVEGVVGGHVRALRTPDSNRDSSAQGNATDLLKSPLVTTKSGSRAAIQITREFLYPTQFQPPAIPSNATQDQKSHVAADDAKGNPTLTLSGGNTYTGSTTATGGTLGLTNGASTSFRGSLSNKVPILGDVPLIGRLFGSKHDTSTYADNGGVQIDGNTVTKDNVIHREISKAPSRDDRGTEEVLSVLTRSTPAISSGGGAIAGGFDADTRYGFEKADGGKKFVGIPVGGRTLASPNNATGGESASSKVPAPDASPAPNQPPAAGPSNANPPPPAVPAVPPAPSPAPPAASPVPAPGPSPTPPAAPETPKLIRNAAVDLEVAAFDPAVDALGAAASQTGGGYVATVNSARLANGKRRGTVVIKVLPERLDAFLARVRDLGDIKNQTVAAEDVTKDYFDTEARVRNNRRMEERLVKMVEESKGKLSEILQVEKELGRVREDIEKMQGQLQLYDSLVRFATVTLEVHEKDLQQPATFLLRQTAELALLSPDVEKTYAETRRAAEDAHAQIVTSDLARASDGRSTATLRLLLAPDVSEGVIARIKALGRVQNFNLKNERVAQNGQSEEETDSTATDTNTNPGTTPAKLERGPVTLNLTIRHDEETHRRVSLTLSAADPAAAFDKARAAGLAAGGEIIESHFSHTHGTHGNGALQLRLPARNEASVLDTARALGRPSDFLVQRDSNAAPDADNAPVLLTLNFADEPVRRRVSFTLVAADLDAAFDQARAAVLAAGGEITDSSFNRPQNGHGNASLTLLVPGKSEAAVLAAVRALGRASDFNIQRDAAGPGDEADAANAAGTAPVSVTIRFADEEPAVQQTTASIRCVDVDKSLGEARRLAADAGARVRASGFRQNTDGGEVGTLEFRVPLRADAGFISRLRSLGEVKSLQVNRQTRLEGLAVPAGAPAAPAAIAPAALGNADDNAPAEVSLTLFSEGRAVSDESGVGVTLRRTLGQGVGAMMWSLRMIGVALAFLAPWVGVVILWAWLARVVARRKHRAAAASAPAAKE